MEHPVEWTEEPPVYEWEYIPETNTVVTTTITTVRTHVHLGRLHEEAPPADPPAPQYQYDENGDMILPPREWWDFLPEALPGYEEEGWPGFPVAEPQPAAPVFEVASPSSSRVAVGSPPAPEYVPGDSSEEEPLEAESSSASCEGRAMMD